MQPAQTGPACRSQPRLPASTAPHTRLFWLQSGRQAPTLSYWCFSPGLSMKQITEMRVGARGIDILFAHTMHSSRFYSTSRCGWAFSLPVAASAALQQLGTKSRRRVWPKRLQVVNSTCLTHCAAASQLLPARFAPSCLPAARCPLWTRLPTSWGWPSLCAWRTATSSTRNRYVWGWCAGAGGWGTGV